MFMPTVGSVETLTVTLSRSKTYIMHMLCAAVRGLITYTYIVGNTRVIATLFVKILKTTMHFMYAESMAVTLMRNKNLSIGGSAALLLNYVHPMLILS